MLNYIITYIRQPLGNTTCFLHDDAWKCMCQVMTTSANQMTCSRLPNIISYFPVMCRNSLDLFMIIMLVTKVMGVMMRVMRFFATFNSKEIFHCWRNGEFSFFQTIQSLFFSPYIPHTLPMLTSSSFVDLFMCQATIWENREAVNIVVSNSVEELNSTWVWL